MLRLRVSPSTRQFRSYNGTKAAKRAKKANKGVTDPKKLTTEADEVEFLIGGKKVSGKNLKKAQAKQVIAHARKGPKVGVQALSKRQCNAIAKQFGIKQYGVLADLQKRIEDWNDGKKCEIQHSEMFFSFIED